MREVLLIVVLGLLIAWTDAAEWAVSEPVYQTVYGIRGEVADESTPTIWFDDYAGLVKGGSLSLPTVPFNPTDRELQDRVKFYLYTKRSTVSDGEQLIVDDLLKLQASSFNGSHPIKIIIHGFADTIHSPPIQEPKNAYLGRGEYNVVGVDWSGLCPDQWFGTAANNSVAAGKYVGKMVRFLAGRAHLGYDAIHMIGHSLGAHVAAVAGKSVSPDKVARITGLDPAGPLYYTALPEVRLQPTDAKFVDALHTCGGDGPPHLGLMAPTAMADFYPNGGVSPQPGCDSNLPAVVTACSHSKAFKLWAETVRHKGGSGFDATSCQSVATLGAQCTASPGAVMGEDALHTLRGVFWLTTT